MAFGALLSLQIITMEPLMLQCVALLMAGIALSHVLEAPAKLQAAKSVFKTGGWGCVFAAGLSAVQLLPSLELLRLSGRRGGYAGNVLGYWSLHPAELINTIVPNLFGNPYSLTGYLYWGEKFHYDREGYLVSVYLGATTLLLALFSFFSSRKKLQWVFGGLTVIGIALALGQFGYLYPLLCKWLAVMRFGRYPVKFMLLVSLALSILASLGLEALLTRGRDSRRGRFGLPAFVLFGLLVGGFLLCFSIYLSSHGSAVENVLRSWISPARLPNKNLKDITGQLVQSFRWAGLFSLIALLLIIIGRFRKRTPLAAGLIVFAVVMELLAQNLRLSPLISGADFEYISELDQYLKPSPNSEIHRVYHVEPIGFLPVRKIWAPNQSVAWLYLLIRRSGEPLFGIMSGVQYSISRSIDDLNTSESDDILNQGYRLKGDDFLTLLAKLNSTVLLTFGEIDSSMVTLRKSFSTGSESKIRVYGLNDGSQRAYFVPNAHWVNSHEKALEQLLNPKFAYKNAVILEGNERFGGEQSVLGKVRILHYGQNEVRCEVESPTEGYLVLLDSYYPGWRASLDGVPVPVLRANYAFRAVKVQAGKHLVEFRYRPASFYLGFLLTGLTLAAGALAWILRPRRIL
jgi:hypothetical protein